MTDTIEKLEKKLATATIAEKFDSYSKLIREYRHKNKFDLSISAMEKAKKLLPEITDRVLKSNYYYQQAIIHFYDSQYPLAQKNLLIAYHLLNRQKADNIDFLLMRVLLAYGTTKQKQGLHHRSLLILKKAETYAKKTKDKNHIARIQNWQAISHANLGENNQALKLNLAALNHFQQENNLEWTANVYNSIGLIYYHLENHQESYNYFQKALDIHAQVETKMGEANVLNNLGMLCRQKKEYSKALQFYQQSIEIRQNFVGNIMLANTYINIASIYLDIKDYKNSILDAKKGLDLSITGEDYARQFDCYIILSYNYIHLKQLDLAQDFMLKAEKLCDSLKRKNCIISQFELMTFFYETQKDFPTALGFQKKINKLQQEINLEKIETQNKLLNKVNEYEKREQLSTIYKERNQALAKANNQLSSSLHKLDVTNHILRHDLLNNLAVITSALKNHERTQDSNYLQHIQLRTKDSIELIKSLSTLSKTPSKIAAEESSTIELNKLITSIMTNYPETEFEIIGSGTMVTDKRMKSVFANLIDNAIRHGKTPKIDFEISQTISQSKIKISDYGKGIDPAIADKIFEKDFHYGETGHTGLGLYIAREIIAENKGKLCYKANQPQGSIFEITLIKS